MFVVFEGLEGSGRSTLSSRVARRFRESGASVEHLTEKEEGGPVVPALRALDRDARHLALSPQAELHLRLAREVQRLDERVRPAFARADVVLCDGFLYDAEVLAHHGRGLGGELVRPAVQAAAAGLQPDLVVLVDVDPHVARARRQVAKILTPDRRPPARESLAGAGLAKRMAAGFRALAAAAPERWVTVDIDGDLERTVERVFTLIKDAGTAGVAPAIERWRAGQAPPIPVSRASTPDEAHELFLRWIDQRAAREPHVAAHFLTGIWGRGLDDRRRTLRERAPEVVLQALTGLDDPVSWELRESLAAKLPGRVARSLLRLPHKHPRARRLRAQLVGRAPVDVVASLEGASDDEAWGLRDRIYSTAADIVVASTMHLRDGRAWATRTRWLTDRGGPAALTSYDLARVACRSVTGVDDDFSWEVREAARAAAPVAALASLAGVLTDRAWSWRLALADQAPRPTFGTVRGSDDARAWDLRARLGGSCKEAIDSVIGMDGPGAWELRDRCADLWPSTVLRSLGPLATTTRGRELTDRQLRNHGSDIGVLKSAAAIAAGALG